jgi:hypothetical protein
MYSLFAIVFKIIRLLPNIVRLKKGCRHWDQDMRLHPEGVKACATPSVYTPPRFGSTAPRVPTSDTEPPASAAQRKDLEVAIGYLLYYGRLVDSRILPTTCALASEQSMATAGTVKRLNHLLGFVSSHRDGHRVFHASDMILAVLSYASYLSRPRARSVTGSFHHLSRVPLSVCHRMLPPSSTGPCPDIPT